ncbi:hypothetical protein NQ317_019813 [Molorchus minor]|uniref:Uncharacterized protein n=1 Tax=Molorchus minor TaxID=1323400 RepID=A0ABQ9J9F4_9CUCU|nr:hypothetical protein NQ317_019813 [Molorchus minor]
MRKLMNVTEELKKKQEEGCYKRNTNLRVPQIEVSIDIDITVNKNSLQFPKNDISINNAVKIKKTDKLEPFADIKAMLEKQDAISVNIKKFENQTAAKLLEFNANKSKIRILENKTIYPPQQVENLTMVQSKEKRSKAIAEKLQKVVQNFNKSISRQNSKKHVDEQKLFRTDTPTAKMGVDKDNVQYGASSGATQELLNMKFLIMLKKKIILGENKFNIQDKSKPTPHKFEFPSRNFTFAERKKIVEHPRSANPQFGSNFFSERSQFFPSSGFGVAFNTMSKNGKDIAGHQNNRFKKPENVDHKQVFLDNDPTRNLNVQKEDNEAGEVVTDTGNFLKMPGMSYKFGNETQFSQILNESYDHEVGYLSPELNTSYINSPPADLATKESDFSSQMFSFGQSNKLFNFN